MLQPLSDIDASMMLELVYATKNNFTGNNIYRETLTDSYLHMETMQRFQQSLVQAGSLGLKIKVWDAFRPLEAQQMLWDVVPDETYISHPRTGMRPHCRGIALDLTLCRENGEELDMGTGFDDFSEKSHHSCLTVGRSAQKNRMLLAGIMHTAGFACNPYEWWHFQLENAEHYPILTDKDLPVSMMPTA